MLLSLQANAQVRAFSILAPITTIRASIPAGVASAKRVQFIQWKKTTVTKRTKVAAQG